jgi:hypothetical protein
MSGTKSRLQGMAERVAAKSLGVDVSEIRAITEGGSERLVGFTGFDIWALVALIMQVLIDQIGNCPARRSTFNAIRNPGLFARVHMRRRAIKAFEDSPHAVWHRMGAVVHQAIEEEAAVQEDEDLAVMFSEAQNPPIGLMLL